LHFDAAAHLFGIERNGEEPMLDFLLGLTLWQLTVAVLSIALATGVGFSVGIRKVFRLAPTTQQADLAIDLMQVTSTYIGILLAFAGVLAWQDFRDADTAIEREAGTASLLYRDLASYGPEMSPAQHALRSYVDSVLVDGWPLLREGKRSPVTETKLLTVFQEVAVVSPTDERQATIYREAFSQLNELVSMRRQRLAASRAQIPPVLWIVALIGSVLTIAYASAFVSSRYAVLMISGTSLTIGLLFLFLLSVEYPFRNRNGVSKEPFIELAAIFDKIDRSTPLRNQVEPPPKPAA
jgi:ABC-type multidrug transport system fused ATPase/permease subunit